MQLAIISVFLIWSAIDYILHDYVLVSIYRSTTNLWRATYDEKIFSSYLVVFVAALIFVCIFSLFFETRTIKAGLIYGLLFGIAIGISVGYGTYASMPIPNSVALGWTIGFSLKGLIGGAVVGLMTNEIDEGA